MSGSGSWGANLIRAGRATVIFSAVLWERINVDLPLALTKTQVEHGDLFTPFCLAVPQHLSDHKLGQQSYIDGNTKVLTNISESRVFPCCIDRRAAFDPSLRVMELPVMHCWVKVPECCLPHTWHHLWMTPRSDERRVGKECLRLSISRWLPHHQNKTV